MYLSSRFKIVGNQRHRGDCTVGKSNRNVIRSLKEMNSFAPLLERRALAAMSVTIKTSPALEQRLNLALLNGNFETAVSCCLEAGRVGDALVLAASGGPELWTRRSTADDPDAMFLPRPVALQL